MSAARLASMIVSCSQVHIDSAHHLPKWDLWGVMSVGDTFNLATASSTLPLPSPSPFPSPAPPTVPPFFLLLLVLLFHFLKCPTVTSQALRCRHSFIIVFITIFFMIIICWREEGSLGRDRRGGGSFWSGNSHRTWGWRRSWFERERMIFFSRIL